MHDHVIMIPYHLCVHLKRVSVFATNLFLRVLVSRSFAAARVPACCVHDRNDGCKSQRYESDWRKLARKLARQRWELMRDLLRTPCSLLAPRCFLLAARCSLLVARCSLLAARCSLFAARRSLLAFDSKEKQRKTATNYKQIP
jgi:hypothetical protein